LRQKVSHLNELVRLASEDARPGLPAPGCTIEAPTGRLPGDGRAVERGATRASTAQALDFSSVAESWVDPSGSIVQAGGELVGCGGPRALGECEAGAAC